MCIQNKTLMSTMVKAVPVTSTHLPVLVVYLPLCSLLAACVCMYYTVEQTCRLCV